MVTLAGNFQIQSRVVLSQFCSWKVGGVAEYYCTPRTAEEVQIALRWANENGHEITVLSGGTNVLISDDGVSGLVIHLRHFTGIEISERENRLHLVALAGTAKSELLKIFLRYRLEPAIFLAGLPGDVGGGVVMNAGIGETIIPREFVEIVDWVEVLKSKPQFHVQRFQRRELKWSYRHCEGWQPGVILKVGMSWPHIADLAVMDRVKSKNQDRLKRQPLEWPSCGSVFVNPEGYKSGQLIDECGLRGFRIGGAQVSEKHANFIINLEHATANDLHAVIQYVQKVVFETQGIQLRTEVVYLGRWTE